MEWSLAIVALTLVGVGAISQRLTGTPVTPAMVFVVVGLLVGPEVLGGIDLGSSSATVRTLAEATLALVLFCDASRIDLRLLRREVGGAGAPAGDRAAADDRPRHPRGRRAVRPAQLGGGTDPGRRAGADRRRAGPGGGHRAARARRDPAGPERGERAQRRHLRPAAVRGRGGGRRGIGDLRGARRGDAAVRGDRLRDRGRRGRRAGGRRHRHPRRAPWADRGRVAAGDPGRGRGTGLRNRERARRIGLHRRVRGRHDLPARARTRPRLSSTT